LTRIKQMIKKFTHLILIKIYYIFIKLLPINGRVIVLESNHGRNYSDNPKYIYEEFVRRGLDKKYKFVWILEDPNIEIVGRHRKVKRFGLKCFYYLAVAQSWIFNCREPEFLVKREGCTYFQTWHGTPLKKLALDMTVLNMGGESDLEAYKEQFHKSTRSWDFLISQNQYSTEKFKKAFAFEKEIWEIGYPRNDILIKGNNKEYIHQLKLKLGIPNDKKVILYAPTWRDDEYHDYEWYKFNTHMDLDYLKQHLQDEYVLIIKMHYLIMDKLDVEAYKGFVYVYTPEQDINELYLVSDMLITDYSSVMFDYSLLKRPMIFFTYDLEQYKNNIRGFYFDLFEDAPGPAVTDNAELLESIRRIDYEFSHKYKASFERFYKKFNHKDDGNSSKRAVDKLLHNLPQHPGDSSSSCR
jgi:CDP-glycerol glycerophosphotransferase